MLIDIDENIDEFDGEIIQDKMKWCQTIEHLDEFNVNISSLYEQSHMSDLTLIIEGQEVKVNRGILAVRSDYFNALLYNGMKESNLSRIEIPNTNLKPFKLLLKYIYSGRLTLHDLSSEDIADLLGTARTFCFNNLVCDISQYLRLHINQDNIWSIYRAAKMYDLNQLLLSCERYFDKNAESILRHEEFLDLNVDEIKTMVKRDSFYAPEPIILRAICNYYGKRASGSPLARAQLLEDLLASVRLSLLKSSEIKAIFSEYRIPFYDPAQMANKSSRRRCSSSRQDVPSPKYSNISFSKRKSLASKSSTRGSNHTREPLANLSTLSQEDAATMDSIRGYLIYNRNIATREYHVEPQKGRQKKDMIDSTDRNYTVRTCTNHTVAYPGQTRRECIQVAFGRPFIVNNIRMLLLDDGQRSFSYIVEVSTDSRNWTKIIDYSNYWCRSWQHLFFKERVVKYVRITGTRSLYYGQVASQMLLVYFECMYNTIDAGMYTLTSQKDASTEEIGEIINPISSVIEDNSIAIARSPISTMRHFRLRAKGSAPPSTSSSSSPQQSSSPTASSNVCNVSPANSASQNNNSNLYYRTDFARGSANWSSPSKITFQLAQPFRIDSFAFCLKQSNCHHSLSSYTVSISNDNENGPWTIVKEVSRISDELIVIKFEPQIVTFIKLKLADVSTTSQLYVKHFECPYRATTNYAIASSGISTCK